MKLYIVSTPGKDNFRFSMNYGQFPLVWKRNSELKIWLKLAYMRVVDVNFNVLVLAKKIREMSTVFKNEMSN